MNSRTMKHVTCDSGLLDVLLEQGHDFFTGVPDSALKQFIGELPRLPAEQHVPATWEAEAVGIAAGAYLAGRR
jgi:phosphonopyruvate decarboxylase